MAIESKRGCGYRKVGGLYMVGGKLGAPCCKLPIPLHVCPTCSGGVKQTRGWTWIDPRPWLQGECRSGPGGDFPSPSYMCPAASADGMGERVGLLWIGKAFYPNVEAFIHEANTQGISRRLTAIPRGLKIGESWVFLAHPEAVTIEGKPGPGIFRVFQPTAIEKLITQSQAADAAVMEDLEKKGINAVVVPDDDKDHQGTVYEDDDAAELPLAGEELPAPQHRAGEGSAE